MIDSILINIFHNYVRYIVPDRLSRGYLIPDIRGGNVNIQGIQTDKFAPIFFGDPFDLLIERIHWNVVADSYDNSAVLADAPGVFPLFEGEQRVCTYDDLIFFNCMFPGHTFQLPVGIRIAICMHLHK